MAAAPNSAVNKQRVPHLRSTRQREMAAYDRLPEEVRHALSKADFSLSCEKVEQFMKNLRRFHPDLSAVQIIETTVSGITRFCRDVARADPAGMIQRKGTS